MNITKEQYETQLREYIKKQPETASGFYGNWARYAALKRQFDEQLAQDGIIVE